MDDDTGKYQTRADSDEDWESAVLNLVRRPRGMAGRGEGGMEGGTRVGKRGLFING